MLPLEFHTGHGQAIHAYPGQQIAIGESQPPVACGIGKRPRTKNKGYGNQRSFTLYMFPASEEMMSIKESGELQQKNGKTGQKIFIGERCLHGCAGATVQQTADHQQDDQVAVTIEPGQQRSGYNG